MEALVFDGTTKKLEYRSDYPLPPVQYDNDVMIRVHYSGVCGTDIHIIQGEYPVIMSKPLILGHEFSGVVEKTGSKSKFRTGQRVVVDPNGHCGRCDWCRRGDYNYCKATGRNTKVGTWTDGGWAQYVVMPESNVFILPDKVTLEQGALCEPYSCVSHGFSKASPISVGRKILVAGAGIIGNLWTTTLHLLGHRDVTICEVNQKRLKIIGSLDTGYRLVTPDVLAQEMDLYDVIIDCTGVGMVMETNFHYLSQGGKYVLFGCCPPEDVASLNPFDIYNKELTVIGVKVNPYSFIQALRWLSAMGDRYLNYEKLGIKTYTLSQYQEAIEDLKRGAISKAIFKVVNV